MPFIFHGLLLVWMNYPAFMTHIRCIILYAVKLDFYSAATLFMCDPYVVYVCVYISIYI